MRSCSQMQLCTHQLFNFSHMPASMSCCPFVGLLISAIILACRQFTRFFRALPFFSGIKLLCIDRVIPTISVDDRFVTMCFVSQSVVLQIGPREAIICADTASGDMKKLKATFERCHVACSEKKRGDFSADVTQDLNKLSNAPEKHIRTYSFSVSSLFA